MNPDLNINTIKISAQDENDQTINNVPFAQKNKDDENAGGYKITENKSDHSTKLQSASTDITKSAEILSDGLEETPNKQKITEIDLDEFQLRQKFLKEQNQKRKELLVKKIAEKAKKTEDEARQLKEIQGEFRQLNALLSSDVSILRHQIEVASVELLEAQYVVNSFIFFLFLFMLL